MGIVHVYLSHTKLSGIIRRYINISLYRYYSHIYMYVYLYTFSYLLMYMHSINILYYVYVHVSERARKCLPVCFCLLMRSAIFSGDLQNNFLYQFSEANIVQTKGMILSNYVERTQSSPKL